MPATAPRDSTLAVVGDGFGSLIVQSTAIYLGFRPEDITIYGPNDNPVGTYQQYAYNLGQTVLRSESESHFLPADWPTFAQLDAWSHRNPALLFRSSRASTTRACRRSSPRQGSFSAASIGSERGSHAVGWLQREAGPPPHFVLYDEQANFVGRAKHVMLALGHGPLPFPPLLAKATRGTRLRRPHRPGLRVEAVPPGGRYIVIGAGIASVNEWANALDAGAKVLALRRSPAPEEQDLNVPRCLFEALGIDVFQGQSFDARIEYLGRSSREPRRRGAHGSPGSRRAARRAASRRCSARSTRSSGAGRPARPHRQPPRGRLARRHRGRRRDWVQQVGADAAAAAAPGRALRHPGRGRADEAASNCGVPGLDRADSRLCMIGINANNVIPHGDTIAGLKYIGRRFVADCARAEHAEEADFPGRLRMQLSLSQRRRAGDAPRPPRRAARLDMCPTVLGRLQTRTAMIVGPALLGLILSLGDRQRGLHRADRRLLPRGVILDTSSTRRSSAGSRPG